MKNFKSLCVIIAIVLFQNLQAQTVYTTKTGEKYHTENCKYLKYSKEEITLKVAKELGYSACKVCKPIQQSLIPSSLNNNSSSSSQPNASNTTSKKAVATQCTGKTQSGLRCKRKTKSTNGRCYQH